MVDPRWLVYLLGVDWLTYRESMKRNERDMGARGGGREREKEREGRKYFLVQFSAATKSSVASVYVYVLL